MRTLVFTICAKNYIGLSRVLEQSVRRHAADADFRIYVADDPGDALGSDGVIRSASSALSSIIDATEFANMAFMYNLTEFCTALKAACFMRGFADGYDRCIYMDPDIFVTGDLGPIIRELDGNGEDGVILITPHLCLPAEGDGPRSDRGILATGVYNLGFLALGAGRETERFLHWWHARLRNQAFNDHYTSLYTDQRWIDFVPSLFSVSSVKIWRHLGCNVAPWNYHERRILTDGSQYAVQARRQESDDVQESPVIFLHFSGFDFRRILDGRFDQLNLADAESFDDLSPLYELYKDHIQAMADEMKRHLSTPYGFDRFADGVSILPSHRRLFRVWRERHSDALDPFSAGPDSFHAALKLRQLLGAGGAADLVADKLDGRSVQRPDKLMARARIFFRLLFRLTGRARFFFLVRALNKLSHIEQHYDTFQLDDATIATFSRSGLSR